MKKTSGLAIRAASAVGGLILAISVSVSAAFANSVLHKNTLHMGQVSDPHSLNPFQVQTFDSAFVASNLYEGLVVLNADGDIVPAQAQQWRLENGGKRMVFTLRPGLRWSNGDPLTASDFVAGIRHLANPANGFMMATKLKMMRLKNIDGVLAGDLPVEQLGVSAPNEQTVVIDLEAPVVYAMELIPSLVPLHKSVLSQSKEAWSKLDEIVVNGAYRPSQWIINERLHLQKNPRYWQADQVAIDEAVLYPLAPETEFKHYEAGALHMTGTVLPGRAEWLKSKYGDQLRTNPLPGTYFYLFNLNNPKLQEPALRRALALGVDRRLITDRVMGYGQKPSQWFVPEDSVKATAVKPPTLAETVATIETQPLKDGEQPVLEILYNTMDSHRQVALAVSDMWKNKLGVRTSLRNMEWNALVEEIGRGEFEVLRMGWTMGSPHPCFLYVLFKSGEAVNQTGYHSAEYDQAFEQACYGSDKQQREQALLRIEQILARDMPGIPLYNYTLSRLISPEVKGFPAPHQYPYFRIQDLSLSAP